MFDKKKIAVGNNVLVVYKMNGQPKKLTGTILNSSKDSVELSAEDGEKITIPILDIKLVKIIAYKNK